MARKYLGESGVIFFAVAVAVSALGKKLLVVFCGFSWKIFLILICARLIQTYLELNLIICLSGNTMCSLLGTSRYLQAAGAQGVLPGVFGLISRRFRTPVFALFYMASFFGSWIPNYAVIFHGMLSYCIAAGHSWPRYFVQILC